MTVEVEGLLPVAWQLVGAVHDWDAQHVDDLLAGRTRQDLLTLTVILAAAVEEDRTPADLIGWTDEPHPRSRKALAAFRRSEAKRLDALGWGPSRIARALGCDHTTVLHHLGRRTRRLA